MWTKTETPVLMPDNEHIFYCPVERKDVAWMSANVYNPAAVVEGETLHLFFRADAPYGVGKDDCGNNKMTCRIGHATSEDGEHFTVLPYPVLYPMPDECLPFEWWGGCQDLHIAEGDDGRFYMNYTAWTGKYDGRYEYGQCLGDWQDVLLCAVSDDLIHWEKLGPALPMAQRELWNHSRSGVIVSTLEKGHPKAVKIGGKYWAYLSHRGYLASSPDLVRWKQEKDEDGNLICLFPQYPDIPYFAGSCEAGAGAILEGDTIAYYFNAMSKDGLWSIGCAYINRNNLKQVVTMEEKPLLKPELPHELQGHTKKPCIVCNTIVKFKGKTRMYYGAADHTICQAILEE